jgi:6,7-dimethyl-8-ribityllumazine synthase
MAGSDAAPFDPSEAARLRARVGTTVEGDSAGRGLRFGIAVSRFNGAISLRLLEGALDGLAAVGVDRNDVVVAWAPGALELPLLARGFVTAARPVDAVVTLGAVIRGETTHYEIVSQESARSCQHLQLAHGVPIIFGVLTVENLDQALARSQPDETNKGREAALTAVEMVTVLRKPPFTRP